MKRLTKLLVAASAVAVGLAWMAIPASADGPTGYGFGDNAPHTIVLGGSDTTYGVMQGIADLYDRSSGCFNSTASDTNLGKCLSTRVRPTRRRRTPAADRQLGARRRPQRLPDRFRCGLGIGPAVVRPVAGCTVIYVGAVNDSPGFANCPNVDIARSSSYADATDVTNGDEVGWASRRTASR